MTKQEQLEKLLANQHHGLVLAAALQKEILSFRQATFYMDMSESQLYKLTSSNGIEHFKPAGKKIYFRRKALDAWMLQNRQATIQEEILQCEDQLIRRKNGSA